MAAEPRKVFHRLPTRAGPGPSRLDQWRTNLLAPVYWGLAHALETPGLSFQRRATRFLLRAAWRRTGDLPLPLLRDLLVAPMESVRYFELDFAWRELRGASGRYLDLSSPRLFPLVFVGEHQGVQAELVNPDESDLEKTRRLVSASLLGDRCRLHKRTVEECDFPAGSFDAITSISVVEHIPDDTQAVRTLWSLLAPGGKLVLTVPVAAQAFDEYIDFNEYGLLAADADGFVFGQRYYDEARLSEHILSVTGPPRRQELFGERVEGAFFADRRRRLQDPRFPVHREPFATGLAYRGFSAIRDLPGIGVAAMSFVKPARG